MPPTTHIFNPVTLFQELSAPAALDQNVSWRLTHGVRQPLTWAAAILFSWSTYDYRNTWYSLARDLNACNFYSRLLRFFTVLIFFVRNMEISFCDMCVCGNAIRLGGCTKAIDVFLWSDGQENYMLLLVAIVNCRPWGEGLRKVLKYIV